MKTLRPALAALLTVLMFAGGLDAYARRQIRRHVARLAALNLPENTRGVALGCQIFALPRCLPVYGSSELDIPQPTRADLFFHAHSPDFRAVVIGRPGDRCIVMLQELAALGEAVRGKKVALFLSPTWFTRVEEAADAPREHRPMVSIFSPLQAGRTLLNTSLSPATRRAVAARLLDYDGIVRERSPLVSQAAHALGPRAWPERGRLLFVTPLLALQNGVLGFQDRVHQVKLLRTRPALRPEGHPYRSRRKLEDWSEILADVSRRADKVSPPASAGSNPGAEPKSPHPDEDFLARLARSPEWGDLDLLLRTLRELGARPLLVNQPINGPASDRVGVSPVARRQFYDRVLAVAARHRVPCRDFSDHEEDPAFFADLVHPSAEAWVYYDRALAEFYAAR